MKPSHVRSALVRCAAVVMLSSGLAARAGDAGKDLRRRIPARPQSKPVALVLDAESYAGIRDRALGSDSTHGANPMPGAAGADSGGGTTAMSIQGAEHTGSVISGFHMWVFLWIWVPVVLIYGLWRSLYRPDPDEIRPSGPLV